MIHLFYYILATATVLYCIYAAISQRKDKEQWTTTPKETIMGGIALAVFIIAFGFMFRNFNPAKLNTWFGSPCPEVGETRC